MKYTKVAILAAKHEKAIEAAERLKYLYPFVDGALKPQDADLVIVLGGDGFLLHTAHELMDYNIPIYGMNRGTVGFLMNKFNEKGLLERIEKAEVTDLHPLEMTVTCMDGTHHVQRAINEVSLLRESAQASKLKVTIDGEVHIDEMVCDGVLVATPAGSTAYNLSAGGPVVPLTFGLLAVTPLSVFRPRRWRGALIPSDKKITFDVIRPHKRPVSAVADFHEFKDVSKVEVIEDKKTTIRILFDSDHTLLDRMIKEQFSMG
jgi:NAD+ kinase